MSEQYRLNKYLSASGVCSRREADRLLTEGRITVDGKPAELGMKVHPEQNICLDGKPVIFEEKPVILAFHKPAGIVCTSSKKEKNNIIDYIGFDQRIYPVGRLDKDSTGLILLTNDGEITDRILRGKNGHEKEYIVQVNRPIHNKILDAMRQGVPILDTITRPCKIDRIDDVTFRIILTQGLNRQIRRMCEYFGYKVTKLKRIRIMNIHLDHLPEGKWRYLTDEEQKVLDYSLKGQKFYND